MTKNHKRSLIFLVLLAGFFIIFEGRLLEPTNYLKCEMNKKDFYLKIIQRTYVAEEYLDKDYKLQVADFELGIKENYMSFVKQGDVTYMDGKSRTDTLFFLNRKTLKIYDPVKKINLGQCISTDNKI